MVTLLNFILETLKNNENYKYVILDGLVAERNSLEVVDKDNQIIKLVQENTHILVNLNLVKIVEFNLDKASILQVL